MEQNLFLQCFPSLLVLL